MIRNIISDKNFLREKCEIAIKDDYKIIEELKETLRELSDKFIGLPANVIGYKKRIIVFIDLDNNLKTLVNPKIIRRKKPFEAEEGCLCYDGNKLALRYGVIEVEFLDENFEEQTEIFTGLIGQTIQHEINHLDGIIL